MPLIHTLVTMFVHVFLALGLGVVAEKLNLTNTTEVFIMYFVLMSFRYLYSLNKLLTNLIIIENSLIGKLEKTQGDTNEKSSN